MGHSTRRTDQIPFAVSILLNLPFLSISSYFDSGQVVTHQSALQFHLLLRQLVLRRRQIENGSWFEIVN